MNKGAPPEIEFVPCEKSEDDARRIMNWRNDPETLSASFHSDPKIWERFWPEFRSAYFPGGACPDPVIVYSRGRPVGFLRFRPVYERKDLTQPACDISIVLDRTLRGQGLGRDVLVRAQAYLRDRGLRTILAEVRADNLASRRVFASAGFATLGVADRVVPDTCEICRVESFVARLDWAGT